MPPEEKIQSPGATTADMMYPSPDPVVDPTPDPDPAPDPEPVAADPVVDPAADPVADPVADPEPIAADPEADPDTIEVSSVEELAAHFEFDPEWMTNLKITQKINGEDVTVMLSDALATHRKVRSGDAILSEAKEKRTAIIAEANASKGLYENSIAEFSSLLQEVKKELDADTKSIDWAALRRDDPAEYSARKDDVRDRNTRFEKLATDAVTVLHGASKKNKDAAYQRKVADAPAQHKIFLDRIPEWKDAAHQKKEKEQFFTWIRNEGATDEQLQELSFDGKMMSFMVKAMRYDQSKTKSDAARKKVVTVPKVLKPGVKQSKPKPNGKDRDTVDIMYGPS